MGAFALSMGFILVDIKLNLWYYVVVFSRPGSAQLTRAYVVRQLFTH